MMFLYEFYTRQVISALMRSLQKKKNITQKQITTLLQITRDRYVRYALRGCPIEKLTLILNLLEIDIFEFMDLADIAMRDSLKSGVPSETSHVDPNKYTTIEEALDKEIRECWMAMNPNTITLVEAWMKEVSLYCLYLLIVKQSFIKEDDLDLIHKYKISIQDYIIFLYYGLKHDEIINMYENQVGNVYLYPILKPLLHFYNKQTGQKSLSSLPALIQISNITLSQK